METVTVNATQDWWLEMKTEGKGRWYGRLFPPGANNENSEWLNPEQILTHQQAMSLRDPYQSFKAGQKTNFFQTEAELYGRALAMFSTLAEGGAQFWLEEDWLAGLGIPRAVK